MDKDKRTALVLNVLFGSFLILAAAFALGVGERRPVLPPMELVDPAFLDTASVRQSYADLVRAKEDLSDFDCYACHERDKPPPIKFDADQNIIIPKEHENIVMGHGSHHRNNNCYNCHNESNLEQLQARDRHALKFDESTRLCGSCHGPTFRDWEAGVHGRTSGNWNRTAGEFKRLDCVNCHNPHSPRFPARQPAPGPNTPQGKSRAGSPAPESH